MKATRTITKEETVTVCDNCGSANKGAVTCVGCGIDVCRDCSSVADIEEDIPSVYSPRACKGCQALIAPYVERVRAIKEDASQRIEIVAKEWSAECRAAREAAT